LGHFWPFEVIFWPFLPFLSYFSLLFAIFGYFSLFFGLFLGSSVVIWDGDRKKTDFSGVKIAAGVIFGGFLAVFCGFG
jgi:hypothetical protein